VGVAAAIVSLPADKLHQTDITTRQYKLGKQIDFNLGTVRDLE